MHFSTPSVLKNTFSHLAYHNLQIVSLRSTLLGLCLVPLSQWLLILLTLGLFQVNGLWILGLGALVFILQPRLQKHFSIWLALGVFFLGAELALKNSNILLSIMSDSGFGFFLTDNRWTAGLQVFAWALALGLLLQIENAVYIFVLILSVAGVLADNNVLWALLGTEFSRILYLLIRTYSLDKTAKKIIYEYSFIYVLSFVLAGALLLNLRVSFFEEYSIYTKVYSVLIDFIFILFIETVFLLIWGHWRAKKIKTEDNQVQYFPTSWLKDELLILGFYPFIKTKVLARLAEMRYHLQGLGSLPEGKIPASLKHRLESEEKQLSQIFQHLS
jgi:hypothetical protein